MAYEAAHAFSKQSEVGDVLLFLSQMSWIEAVFYIVSVSVFAYFLKRKSEKKV